MNVQIAAATVDDARQILAYYTELLAEGLAFIMDNPVPTLAEEIEFIEARDGERSLLLPAGTTDRVVGSARPGKNSRPPRAQSSRRCRLYW